ncbi:MAG: PIN domain-containing protein [Planctomycetaceae bacterium]|nr:PIN domain-containing protein [Planctomycetaceae bacterium]
MILLDTNIILDYAQIRENFFEHARKIFEKIDNKNLCGFISASSVTDIFYLLLKKMDTCEAKKKLVKLLRILKVLPVDRQIIDIALDSSINDFEDAVQVFAARAMNISIVVTRDKTGFVDSGMTVFTPHEFLTYLESQ